MKNNNKSMSKHYFNNVYDRVIIVNDNDKTIKVRKLSKDNLGILNYFKNGKQLVALFKQYIAWGYVRA